MITQYQRKYKFTAILISHDIPDVYFISNRLLVLYDNKIIFQGTPKAFEDFKHPYHDELIRSFNQLQKGLNGLTSKRHFKVRYQIDLDLKNGTETYAFALFTLEDFDAIINRMGYKASQKSIKTMGAYINRRFGAMGGFSARRSINQFGTVLPYSDIDEARRLLERFITDLQKEGLAEIEAAAKTENPSMEGVKFSILAGLASGNPDLELPSVMECAEFTQKPIAQF
jgi:phospholipid/cholesterol/gamma-HCH transport system ATP-binding protein